MKKNKNRCLVNGCSCKKYKVDRAYGSHYCLCGHSNGYHDQMVVVKFPTDIYVSVTDERLVEWLK